MGTGILRAGLAMLAGPILWAMHFALVYAGHAALCAAGDRLPFVGQATLPWLLAVATAAAIAGLAALAASPRLAGILVGPASPSEAAFLARIIRLLAALSLFAVAAAAIAMAIVPACDSLR
ncbi:MAG: hypothetical protein AB7P02_14490 [Alphaproteobacteria bacterium]